MELLHNESENQFEADLDGGRALVVYRRRGETITFLHTEVPQSMSGQGIGSKLVRYALDYARDNDLKVRPFCPFVRGYIERHPDYQPLVVQ